MYYLAYPRTVALKITRTVIVYFRLMLVAVKVADNFVSPLLDAVLLDYQRNVASAREPEVLSTMAVIVDKLDVSYQLC